MSKFPVIAFCLLVVATVGLSGCGHTDHRVKQAENSWKKSELYFGLNRTSETEWKKFVSEVILPRFPEGFSILDAEGYWLPEGTSKTQRESSKVLVILHPGEAQSGSNLEEIRREFKKRFRQESVLRVDYPARVSF